MKKLLKTLLITVIGLFLISTLAFANSTSNDEQSYLYNFSNIPINITATVLISHNFLNNSVQFSIVNGVGTLEYAHVKANKSEKIILLPFSNGGDALNSTFLASTQNSFLGLSSTMPVVQYSLSAKNVAPATLNEYIELTPKGTQPEVIINYSIKYTVWDPKEFVLSANTHTHTKNIIQNAAITISK